MGLRFGQVVGVHGPEQRIDGHAGVEPVDERGEERLAAPPLVGRLLGLPSHVQHVPTVGRPRLASDHPIPGVERANRGSTVFEWSEEQLMVRDAVRRFVEAEVVPNIDALEHGDMPPYDIIRKLYATFGMDQLARDRFKAQLERKAAGAGSAGAEGRQAAGPSRSVAETAGRRP